MATGTTTLDFGAFPGKPDASVVVTGQSGITSGSRIEAWIELVNSADHSADEHMLESLKVFAGNIVAGTGFTVYGMETMPVASPYNEGHCLHGTWTVAWVWN